MGFTTLGGWADAAALLRSSRMDLALTPVLGAGMEAGVPWFDLWNPEIIARVETLARERIEPVRDEPRLLGCGALVTLAAAAVAMPHWAEACP